MRCALFMGPLKIIGSSWHSTITTATLPQTFNGLLFQLSLLMCMQNLNFIAIPIPDIIGGTPKKFGQSLVMPTLPFFQKF